MKLLTNEELSRLTTKRLLAYKNVLMKVPEGPNWEGEAGFNKTSDLWKNRYDAVKCILASREHVERKTK